MPAGIIFAIYGAVFAVMQLCLMFARVTGEFIGLVIALTINHPKIMLPLLLAGAVVGTGIIYGPSLYHSTRGEAIALVSGVGLGKGSNSTQCREARSADPMLAAFDKERRPIFQEALDQNCWRLPAELIETTCPAHQFDATARPDCIRMAEQCYRSSMEFGAGLTNSAISTRDCLEKIVLLRSMDQRRAQDSQREAQPDGDWVRLSQSDDVAVMSAVTAAFGGVSPMVRQDEQMSARDPQYLRFQSARVFGAEQLAAAMAVSHKRSHFVVAHRMRGLDMSDSRDTTALFVLGRGSKPQIVVPIGYAGFKYQSYVARATFQGRDREVALSPIAGANRIYVMDDAPFERLVVYGDRTSEATALYELNASPRLDDRGKFFAAVAKSVSK